tara:strand:- start:119 stop:424 length:306 start_codon:yes stop_codon:yes gene_type:complete
MANRLRNIKKITSNNKKPYYKNIEYPNISVSPNDIYIITKSTDRLDLLANDYYRNPNAWWIIAKANTDKIQRDSLFLNPGLQIRIPMDINLIYDNFSKLNK